MNLGVRVSGFSAVMLKPPLSEISEEMHTHRRMTLERMMLDSFVLTGGFELPCFRPWAALSHTSVRLYVCVGGAHIVWACMHLQHRCAGPLVYAWPSHSWSSTQMPFGAVWWEDEKKTRDEMDDRRPFHQSPFWAQDPDYLSWPRQPCLTTLKSLALPQTIHVSSCPQAQNSLSFASFHPPFAFISSCQRCARLQSKFTSPGAAKTRLRHTGTNSRPHRHTHQRWY